MTIMNDELKKAIAEIQPSFVASADKDGHPNVSAKGSLCVIDDEHLVFADIRSPQTLKNVKENPYVSIIALESKTRKGWRVWGKVVDITTAGDIYDMLSKKYKDKGGVNHAVKILVEKGSAL